MSEMAKDYASEVNPIRGGFNVAMALEFERATLDEVVATIAIGPQHLQPYGLVHGGVYSGMVETLCSTGAALVGLARGQTAVGLDNSTSFLKAVRGGRLRGRAVPLSTGRRSQLWEARIHDGDGRLVAVGRVRLLCLEAGAEAAGETVEIVTKPDESL